MLVENPLQARWYQMASLLSARNVNVAQLLPAVSSIGVYQPRKLANE